MSGGHNHKRKKKKRRAVPSSVEEVQATLSQEHPDHERSEDMKNPKSDSPSRRDWTIWFSLFISVVTVIAYFTQACYMRQANTNSIKQFGESQRPYLWVAPNKPESATQAVFVKVASIAGKPDGPVTAILWYQNYGSSPAIVTQVSSDVEIGKDAANKLKGRPWVDSPSVDPPQKPDALTIESTDQVTDANRSDFISNQIFILGKIRYASLAGHRYESDLCIETTLTNSKLFEVAEYCPPTLTSIGCLIAKKMLVASNPVIASTG